MSRIKRWFPVNHNINRDPEIWVMRREIGEKSLSIWLEFLSIADQNEGDIPGAYEALIRSVSGTCQATVRTVTAVYQYAIRQVWLKSQPTLHVVKYWNYHKSREPQKTLLGSLLTNPSDPSEPILPKKEVFKSPLKRKPTNKTVYPESFEISEALRNWCLAQRVTAPEIHLEAFRDYHVAKSSRFSDWDAAFRTWIRNSARFGAPRQAEGELDERTKRILKRGL